MKNLFILIISALALSISGCQKANDSSQEENVIKSYTIRLDARGGSVSNTEIIVSENGTFALPIPVYPGYEFVEWKDIAGNTVESGTYSYQSDVALYAIWQIIHYSITYDFKGVEYTGPLTTSYTVEDIVEEIVGEIYDEDEEVDQAQIEKELMIDEVPPSDQTDEESGEEDRT